MMKRVRISALFAFGLLLQAPGANAWWQWYYQDIPFSAGPGLWFYQYIPQAGVPGVTTHPGIQYSQPAPQSFSSWWMSPMPTSGLYVQQSQTAMGYSIRVHSGGQAVDLGVDGHTLLIRSRNAGQSAWASRWVSLPVDANIAATRVSRGPGLVEIFVPRRR